MVSPSIKIRYIHFNCVRNDLSHARVCLCVYFFLCVLCLPQKLLFYYFLSIFFSSVLLKCKQQTIKFCALSLYLLHLINCLYCIDKSNCDLFFAFSFICLFLFLVYLLSFYLSVAKCVVSLLFQRFISIFFLNLIP